MTDALLEVDHVCKEFVRGGLLSRQRIRAVDDVSFSLAAGRPEIFAIIGESGSGKSTLAAMILNVLRPSSGNLRLRGTDLAEIRGRAARLAFMAQVQPIFQNPFEAFNPLKQLDHYLFMTARRFIEGLDEVATTRRVEQALDNVGLSLAEVRGRFPHELSGGQLQRIAVARALIPSPAIIIADEPVSMVDASLRMSIVNLFRKLRDDLGISIVYITHDLATAYYMSDRIVIMQRGKVVESGDARAVLANPQHPYSQQLKSAVLLPDTITRVESSNGGPSHA
jgi:ABC-type oligopeptide transport system ATPase subunit